jgi:hypothetical protein
MKKDFSYILAENNYKFDEAIAEDMLAKDYSKAELVKETIKASIRRYIIGKH